MSCRPRRRAQALGNGPPRPGRAPPVAWPERAAQPESAADRHSAQEAQRWSRVVRRMAGRLAPLAAPSRPAWSILALPASHVVPPAFCRDPRRAHPRARPSPGRQRSPPGALAAGPPAGCRLVKVTGGFRCPAGSRDRRRSLPAYRLSVIPAALAPPDCLQFCERFVKEETHARI
jgi:hypothetical protein